MSDLHPPDWAARYIGVPYVEKGRDLDGADCWGITRLALQDQFGLAGLPSYADNYESSMDRTSVAAVVESALELGWKREEEPFAGALVIIQLAGRPWHCGTMLNARWMLHSLPRINSVCERIDGLTWARRIVGFYRAA